MYRVVLDPGVLVAALLSASGPPARLLLAWRDGRLDLVVSPKLLAELARVLSRPRLRQRISGEDAVAYLSLLAGRGVSLEDPEPGPSISPDPGDDYLIDLARTARADFLVSGDRHLTRLKGIHPPIVTPRQLLDLLAGAGGGDRGSLR